MIVRLICGDESPTRPSNVAPSLRFKVRSGTGEMVSCSFSQGMAASVEEETQG